MSRVTLFCLPHAGGSATIYNKWQKYLDNSIALYRVELSGRGKRFNQNLYNSMEEAIEDIYYQIKPLLISPFSFFGHSMGSLLAYELCCKIKQQDGLDPVQLFVAGGKAPQCRGSERKLHLLPDDQFKRELKKLGGTPEEILGNNELYNFFSPVLKADYKIIEEYEYPLRNNRLNCGITVLNGTEDNIKAEELMAWNQLTNGKCNIIYFKGGHFFINNHLNSIVQLISETITLECMRKINFV
ncbi:thioesterase domain-containing protein [Paenibacillus sp. FSL R7-0345]|uniref:thioesterase II family protein n=1 Tax=Paenibacillus sp. FSL R7-0345 TaxID=2954535 RepID=UPI00315A915C